jgi:hypothetical protein
MHKEHGTPNMCTQPSPITPLSFAKDNFQLITCPLETLEISATALGSSNTHTRKVWKACTVTALAWDKQHWTQLVKSCRTWHAAKPRNHSLAQDLVGIEPSPYQFAKHLQWVQCECDIGHWALGTILSHDKVWQGKFCWSCLPRQGYCV